jgi:hypothetical protein
MCAHGYVLWYYFVVRVRAALSSPFIVQLLTATFTFFFPCTLSLPLVGAFEQLGMGDLGGMDDFLSGEKTAAQMVAERIAAKKAADGE